MRKAKTERGEAMFWARTADRSLMEYDQLYPQADVGSPAASYCTHCGYDSMPRTDLLVIKSRTDNPKGLVEYLCPEHADRRRGDGPVEAGAARAASRLAPGERVCPDCFLIHSGECA